jgi:hypothetical protein
MPSKDLTGTKVNLIVSDPWEFGSQHGTGPFNGRILGVSFHCASNEDIAVLLQLDHPLSFEGQSVEYFVVTPRVEGDDLRSLADGALVFVSLTRITEEQACSNDPFNLTRWRGGLGLIGSLERK